MIRKAIIIAALLATLAAWADMEWQTAISQKEQVTKGAHTLGFDTAVFDNTTVLDTSATRVALFFRKQVGDTKHKVRQ